MRLVYLVSLLTGLTAGCSHGELFEATSSDLPARDSGATHQITFNRGNDLFPSWISPDSLAYSFAPDDNGGSDRCVGAIAAQGGTRRTWACRGPAAADSIANSNWPSIGPAGRLVYVWESFQHNSQRPDSAIVYLQEPTDTRTARLVFQFPYVVSGVVYSSATHLGWLNRDTLVAIAVGDVLIRDCLGCPFRTVRTGRAVILFDLTTPVPVLTTVTGTTEASGVTPGATGRDFYYTIAADSRVFHRDLVTESTTTTHDFGSTGIARDPQRAGDRLVAVVGGSVSARVDPLFGLVQEDSGGPIHHVNLVNGSDVTLSSGELLYRHPALSASGSLVVAEGWSGGSADLWFFVLP
jgi:hypothetical protein